MARASNREDFRGMLARMEREGQLAQSHEAHQPSAYHRAGEPSVDSHSVCERRGIRYSRCRGCVLDSSTNCVGAWLAPR